MKYIKPEDLITNAYYHFITYHSEDTIRKYDGKARWCQGYTNWNDIEFVIARVEDLVRPIEHSPMADEIEELAKSMIVVANRMIYFGGFDLNIKHHAEQLIGAAEIANGWAECIRDQGK